MLRTQIFEVEPNAIRTYSNYNEPESNRIYNFLFEFEPKSGPVIGGVWGLTLYLYE